MESTHEEAEELTAESVEAMIGEGWRINVEDSTHAGALWIDWQERYIYTHHKPDLRNGAAAEIVRGHVSVYGWCDGYRMDDAFFLRIIADSAADIAAAWESYEIVWNGHNHVARFGGEGKPDDLLVGLLQELETIDRVPQTRQVWGASEWLSEPFQSLREVYQSFKVDEAAGLDVLIEEIVHQAYDEGAIVCSGELEEYLTDLDARTMECEADQEDED